MALDPVPWMIGGGEAVHSADVARSALYSVNGGANGITRPGDFRCTALPVPGAAVRIGPGGGTFDNRYPGGAGQSYSARAGESTDVPVAATGSAGSAVKYVILRIDDPQYGGQATGPTGPYVRAEIVTSISNLAYPFIELARIDQPANTATITQSMITDLRQVARPRIKTELRVISIFSGQEDVLSSTSAYPDGGETWPEAAENAWSFIDIPDWATRCKIIMHWSGVTAPGGDTWGWAWVQVGYTVNPDNFKTQGVFYDTTGIPNRSRIHIMAADEKPIPAALRGGAHKFYPRANVLGGPTASRLKLDAGSTMALHIEFMERPD